MYLHSGLLGGFLALLLGSMSVAENTHYVAAIKAPRSGVSDGSVGKPWPSLSAALKSGTIQGGDTLALMDGDHDGLNLHDVAFDKRVIIVSQNEKNAHVDRIQVTGRSQNLTFRNLSVWPKISGTGAKTLVGANSASTDITVDGLVVGSGPDANRFLTWNLAEWHRRKIIGIHLKGARGVVRNNTVTGIRFGIITAGVDSLVERNWVNGFSGDGLRGIGDRNIFRGNRVTNCFKIDKNHDDGFQSWSPRKQKNASITGGILEGNTIIEWTEAPGHPLQCRLQGIGMFDGFFDNYIIRNNLISVSAYHGIAVYGGRGVKVVNNTVVSNSGKAQKNPWIGIFNHKNGTPAQDILVANNLAMLYKGKPNRVHNTIFAANSIIKSPLGAFANAAGFNYSPVARSGFIDTAISDYAPDFDIMNLRRPAGRGPDRGAIEVGATQPRSDLK